MVGAVSATVGFLAIGLGIMALTPEVGTKISSQMNREAANGSLSEVVIPLATPIELPEEWAQRLGLGEGSLGRLAMASDHQIAAAVAEAALKIQNDSASAADQGSEPDSQTRPELHPESGSPLQIASGHPDGATRPDPDAPRSSEPAVDPESNAPLSSDRDRGPNVSKDLRLLVRLADGSVANARIIFSQSGVALIELDQRPVAPGRQLATLTPVDTDEVVLLTEQPQIVTYAQLKGHRSSDSLKLVGGTPVVNAEGFLIGLCVEHSEGDHTHFISVDELLSVATSPSATRR
jgi:hypothetical protein